jgi:predicted dehydrogenase
MNLQERLPVVMMLVVGLAALSGAEEKPKEEAASKGPAGHWSCVQNLPGGQTRPFELRLRLDGNALTGSVWVSEGQASATGTADGDSFRLEIQGDTGTYEVKGKVDGDKIGGTWSLGTAEGTWEGTRQPKPAN